MKRIVAVIVSLLVFFPALIFAQISPLGIPFNKQYLPEEYKSAESNWSLTSDDSGIMYFGNEGAILEYDGNSWRTIIVDDDRIQSLTCMNNRVYFGGNRSFGVLRTDALGNHYAQYLSARFGTGKEVNTIWKTYALAGKIYFCSLKVIFIYNPTDDSIQTIDLPKNSFLAFLVDNQLVFGNWEQGLFRIKGNQVLPMLGGMFFKEKDVFAVLPYNPYTWLIGTSVDGLFLYDLKTGKTKIFDGSASAKRVNAFLKTNNFYSAALINDSTYSLGTLGGALVINKKGEIQSLISKKYGLTNEETTNQLVLPSSAQSTSVWLTLTLGLARVDYPSITSRFADESGLLGNVMAIKRYNGVLYAGTMRGLFKLQFDQFGSPEFIQVSQVMGQVNTLIVAKEKGRDVLLVGSNQDIYRISGSSINRFGSEDALTYRFLKPRTGNNVIYVVSERSLKRLVNDKGVWRLDNAWKSINEYCTELIDLKGGNLLGRTKNGLFLIEPSGNTKKLVERIGVQGRIFEIEGNVYVVSDSVSLKYSGGTFVATTEIDSLFNIPAKKILSVFSFSKDKLMLAIKEQTYVKYALATKGKSGWTLNTQMSGRVPSMNNPEIFLDDDGSTVWIGGLKGLFSLNLNLVDKLPKTSFKTLIRSITLSEDSLLYNGNFDANENKLISINTDGNLTLNSSLDFKFNYVTFTVAAPFFEEESKMQYSYYLEGFDRGYLKWTSENRKSYPNLSEGSYKFWVKARNIYGEETQATCFVFEIFPPWYRTTIAYVLYVLLGLFGIYLIVRFYTRKLEEDKKRLELIVKERTAEVVRQKDEILDKNLEIEKKNKDITDSIRYAQRIQTAVLPNKQSSQKLEYFIFFKPRDIVSGDFYWIYHFEAQNVVIAAAVDCTGHGVPGAFMSMLGVAFLNEIASDPAIQHTDEILNVLRDFVIRSLNQTGKEGENKDGMDIGIVRIDLKSGMLEFSGANNPLFLIRDNELMEFKPDKMPIGIHVRKDLPFTRHEIQLQENDILYLFSDGFADQFGGEDKRKYMKKQLKEFLLTIHQEPISQQLESIEGESSRWMGDLEQIDDQLIIGFRYINPLLKS